MQGITDTEITFFSSLPKSGPLAGFGLIADGIKSYFDYINETEGGIDGRKHRASTSRTTATRRTRPRPTSTRRSASGKYAGAADDHRHAEQPGRLGHRSTTSACRSCSTAPAHAQWGDVDEPPVDHGHAARLLLRGRPVGQVAAGRAPRRQDGRRGHVQQRLRQELRRAASSASSRAPTSRSSSSSSTSRRRPT